MLHYWYENPPGRAEIRSAGMLRILYLINHAGKGGTERYVHTLARQLHGAGTEVFFAYNEEGPLVDRMRELGIPVYRNPQFPHAVDKRAFFIVCEKNLSPSSMKLTGKSMYIAFRSALSRMIYKIKYPKHSCTPNFRPTRRILIPIM